MVEINKRSIDAREIACEVLILKYAQGFHGADLAVSSALEDTHSFNTRIAPKQQEHVLIESQGRVSARQVLFMGVVRLSLFDYPRIREFTEAALFLVAQQVPGARHVAMTMHGVGLWPGRAGSVPGAVGRHTGRVVFSDLDSQDIDR